MNKKNFFILIFLFFIKIFIIKSDTCKVESVYIDDDYVDIDCDFELKDNVGIDVIPQPQRATISVGDIKCGNKVIKPIH